MALATEDSWVAYTSQTYKFTIAHPASWTPSEVRAPGWALMSSPSGSDLEVTWRVIPHGTTLVTITDELWKTMHNNGYVVVGSVAETINSLQARLLTVDGPGGAGKQRHGNVALIVTSTGRYRIELWTNSGGDDAAAKLFKDLLATFRTP